MSWLEVLAWFWCGFMLVGIVSIYLLVDYYDRPANKEDK